MSQEEKSLLEQALDEYPELTMKSTYVGEGKEDDWTYDQWSCRLEFRGRSMIVDFKMGTGHRRFPKKIPFYYNSESYIRHKEKDMESSVTLGQYLKEYASNKVPYCYNPSRDMRILLSWAEPTPPTLPDVIYSLILDSDALDQTFEEWCDNYGYYVDSRKAEKLYNKCKEEGIKLIKLLGGEVFEYLRENNEY